MDKDRAFELTKKYLDFLKEEKLSITSAYLFGSHVSGRAHEESDIDIAIVMPKVKNNFDMQVELMKMRRKFDSRIEPHPFAEKDFNDSDPFAREIMRTGIRVL